MTELKFPREVLIVDSKNEWNHNIPVGTVVTAVGDYGSTSKGSIEITGMCDFRDGQGLREATQVIQKEDYIEFVGSPVEKAPTEKAPEKLVAKRVKMIYTVQDSDGDIIFFTQDRELAREVKAEEGGKANGVIIMQYGELKEIR